ncbi:MAG: flagellar hook-length control protein FliK [Gammaproteobacteria bacterium]|nr:flagellar hook-length control protein FliK [Gammaproteobacteria bacterium]
MNISEVSQQLASLFNKAGNLIFSANDEFSNQLTIGQIIKGKVLRSYGSERYLVAFQGNEKVVDSSIPLKEGETVQGRVISLGNKIELKRIPQPFNGQENASLLSANETFKGSKWEGMLFEAIKKYQLELSAQERSLLTHLLKKSEHPQNLLMNAIALIKQNISVSEPLLQMLNKLQNQSDSLSLLALNQVAPNLSLSDSAEDSSSTLKPFVDVLFKLSEEQQLIALSDNEEITSSSQNNDSNEDEGSGHNEQFKFNWQLLNSQVDGAIQHRVNTLPIWLGGQLIEVDIAIYEQQKKHVVESGIQHKKLVFSLELDELGKVDIEMIVENKNLRLHISSDSHSSTQHLLENAKYLNDDLMENAWSLDEIAYATHQMNEKNGIVTSVIEHYASQDSFSRLM